MDEDVRCLGHTFVESEFPRDAKCGRDHECIESGRCPDAVLMERPSSGRHHPDEPILNRLSDTVRYPPVHHLRRRSVDGQLCCVFLPRSLKARNSDPPELRW